MLGQISVGDLGQNYSGGNNVVSALAFVLHVLSLHA